METTKIPHPLLLNSHEAPTSTPPSLLLPPLPGPSPWARAWARAQPQMRRPGPGVDPEGVPRVQPVLSVQARRADVVGGERAAAADEGPGPAGVPGEPGGPAVGGAHRVGPSGHAEPHLHCAGQDRDAATDHAHGHGHQQRRRLDPLLRLPRMLRQPLLSAQVLLLQIP